MEFFDSGAVAVEAAAAEPGGVDVYAGEIGWEVDGVEFACLEIVSV